MEIFPPFYVGGKLMATIGVHSLFGNIQKAVDYIVDENKTEPGLCEGKNINPAIAKYDWSSNANSFNNQTSYDTVNGYHFRQAFELESVTPEEAFQISKEWIEAITGGNHNYVISVHTDKGHIHTHIIVDPLNNKTKKRWRIFYKRDINEFKKISDRICQEHGLNILGDPSQTHSKSYYEHMMAKSKPTNKEIIKSSIDKAISLVSSYDEFKEYLLKLGFEIEDGLDNNQFEEEINDFAFTINQKMFIHDKDRQDEYCIRIPYTQKFIYLKKTDCKFTTDGKMCYTSINVNDRFEIYDKNDNYTVSNGEYIKNSWEDKTKRKTSGRQGLRIKIPNGRKFLRCDYFDGAYSLDDVIQRINNNDNFTIDPTIEKVLNANSEEIKTFQKEFYDDIGISHQDIYNQKTKQQRFFDYKTAQIQKVLDQLYLNNLEETDIKKDVKEIAALKKLKIATIKKLNETNDLVKNAEEEFEEMQKDIFENGDDKDNSVISNFIDQRIAPLRQLRLDLKNQAHDLSERIAKADKYISKHKSKGKTHR